MLDIFHSVFVFALLISGNLILWPFFPREVFFFLNELKLHLKERDKANLIRTLYETTKLIYLIAFSQLSYRSVIGI